MIVKPRIRGFICTTAHPVGCAAHVQAQIDHVKSRGAPLAGAPKRVLVLGCSGGYGLSSRITAAFAGGAATLGVSFEKPPADNKTASAGWYNNIAFERAASAAGLYARTLDGDAFGDDMKRRVVDEIKAGMGQIDMLVYSLASPVRQHPRTGVLHRSSIKPLGEALHIKSVHVDRGEVIEVDLEPATADETANTVAVMGGEDWEFWIDALAAANVLAPGFRTLAFTYIGTELTWPIYWEGTLGKAKEDLDRAAKAMQPKLAPLGGGCAGSRFEGDRQPGVFSHSCSSTLRGAPVQGHESPWSARRLYSSYLPDVCHPVGCRRRDAPGRGGPDSYG